jgi:hypothetical protein
MSFIASGFRHLQGPGDRLYEPLLAEIHHLIEEQSTSGNHRQIAYGMAEIDHQHISEALRPQHGRNQALERSNRPDL